MKTFEGKNYWALIIGGSSGMGLATAEKLANEGINIIVVHRDRRATLEAANKAFEQIRAKGVELVNFNKDATHPTIIQEIITETKNLLGDTGKLRLLLHAIARGNLKPIVDAKPVTNGLSEKTDGIHTTVKEFFAMQETSFANTTGGLELQDYQFTIHAMGTNLIEWSKAVLEHQLFAPEARIIGLTSEGDKKVWKGYAAVAAAKASLDALSKYLAIEFAPFGITTNLVQAGVTDTPSLNMIPGSDILKDTAKMRNPFHRLTRPEDVANAIYLLCRDEGSWINGTTLVVDGGEHLK